MVKVEVDRELYRIIRSMQRDPMVNRAIRRYARTFIEGLPSWDERYEERYRGSKGKAKANKSRSRLKPTKKRKTTEDWSESYRKEWR